MSANTHENVRPPAAGCSTGLEKCRWLRHFAQRRQGIDGYFLNNTCEYLIGGLQYFPSKRKLAVGTL